MISYAHEFMCNTEEEVRKYYSIEHQSHVPHVAGDMHVSTYSDASCMQVQAQSMVLHTMHSLRVGKHCNGYA